jgi:hypothetical protein
MKQFASKQIALISTLCAAGFGLFGCGSDSSGSGPNAQGDVCSVTKSGNTLTVKMDANGATTTTIYEFGDDGNMASQSTVTDVGAGGQTACEAMNVEGVAEASFEDGKCTVKQTAGLMPGSIDQLEQTQQMACDAANEAVKPASNGSNNPGDSGSSGNKPAGNKDICSVTKTSTTITTKANIDGETSTTVFVFDASGDLTSEVITSDLSSLGDDATAEAVCKAGAAGGEATYDKGKCVVTMDVSYMAGVMSLDEIYEAQQEACDALKEEASSTEEGGQPGSSGSTSTSASSTTKSSGSSGTKEKAVTFKDGIIWEPSYESRARTFFNTVDEYTFFDDNEVTKDSSGWWFKYLDDEDNGASTAKGTFSSTELTLSITLVYKGWHTEGSGTSAYNAPNPYPYAGFGFNFSVNGEDETVDISDWEGICITYSATDNFEVAFQSPGDGGMSWYYPAGYSTSTKTVNISFSSGLTRSQYAPTTPNKTTALKNVTSLQIKYSNDEAHMDQLCDKEYYTASECNSYSSYFNADNTIKIYKIGKYGTCSGTTSTTL